MRVLKRVILVLAALVGVCIVLLLVTGNTHILNGIGKTYLIGKSKPDIDDRQYFSTNTMGIGTPEPWPVHSQRGKLTIPEADLSYMDSMQTAAYLIIHNDSLLYEKYWPGTTDTTVSNSFSMAKSFLSILIGVAVSEGYIHDLDQKVGDFIPQFAEGKNSALTIRHLLQMTSGIPFGESYSSPFGYMAKAYYGKNLEKETLKYNVELDPGSTWNYEGGNSVLLGLVLKKATGKTPSQYFYEKIWSCIGAEHPAYWNLDREGGLEKTFSGFYATARDFARVGKLYLHQGVWEQDSLVPPEFVAESLLPVMVPDSQGDSCSWYGMHWWLGNLDGQPFFSCRGMRGQYIAAIPTENLIIVRLGHAQSSEREQHMPPDLLRYMKIATQLVHNPS